ncbi:zinc-binding dehydrogenase [Novosphingobium taihuense]|uniref:(R,R)-butanediol dehydrogenase/meso-butanediol dehydrogenase/diacetyl reductase n=1 Tax=Novosphingobium taihuense TaxID=260085 RepID=A0A7W7ETV7_9SPHN|nr:zinc-binding dehydrogenase [Novosphingobium taihuense]MBB4613773.1 (R,R)-butanediol dehydrogenase/meso-butanediol dehydrogenase/diacetyl reductase [Novosphingobium taihuense]TWH83282.1 (R,R)-butanediol dehydrogenase/meso-butanediol dehydrogenase/diacetyl reductase [Novosphingobium taihuense]
MRAAVMQGLHKPLAVETIPDPTPGEGDVVVKVGRCGICGSDLHMTEDPAYGQGAGSVLGHEFAGEVVALGKGVDGLRTGDLVSVIPLQSCGQCQSCRTGEVQWCERFGLQGGGYAEFALTKPNQCVRLPKSASLADGAIVEPLAVALHGVALSRMKIGDKVLILGAGPIGLAVAFWARRFGAGRVVVQDLAEWQYDRALQMGAHDFVVEPADPVGSSERALGGSADVVFECVGVPGLIAQAVDQVRNDGTIVLLGLCTRPDTFNSFAMLSKQVKLVTSAFFTRQEYEAALDALDRGAVEPRMLVTDTISLDATPDVFESLRKRTHQCKVLISPGE